MIRVLVTGANGQLGKSIQKASKTHKEISFIFKNSRELDISKAEQVKEFFKNTKVDFCINCAAYTLVEEAEKEPEKAFSINAEGVKFLAQACKQQQTVLIHISTDYVFDGTKQSGYTVKDIPNPINQYGKSKLQGEIYIQEILEHYSIIRTSWLYSEYGSNFYKTILKKAKTETVLSITDQQKGCPTNAHNLANYILTNFLSMQDPHYGLYHFNDGEVMTWYDFAKKIISDSGMEEKVIVQRASNYRTFAKRPENSVLLS